MEFIYGLILLVLLILSIILIIAWTVLPFAIFGIKEKLDVIIELLKRQ